jgi:hypothetical protein
MNLGTRRSDKALTARGAVVLEGLATGDFVVELAGAVGVVVLATSRVGVVDTSDFDVVGRSDVGVVDGTLARAPAQPAIVNERATAPATDRPAYQRCCPTETHGSERNDAKWSKLGMMAW